MNALIAKAKVIKGQVHNLSLKLKRRMNWFDISGNLDTSDCVDKELLYDSIESDNKKHMVRYVPTHFTQLKIIFEQLKTIDPTLLESTFVDFGCGKGRVLIMAHRMGFHKIIGVEFSKKLCDICLSNLQKAKTLSVDVMCADAVNVPLTPDMRTFYFCNPFEFCVLEKVLDHIRTVLRTAPKPGYIVYIDPRKFGKLDPAHYDLVFQYDGPGTIFHIYKVLV